jgi:hypothetical protein
MAGGGMWETIAICFRGVGAHAGVDSRGPFPPLFFWEKTRLL